jgi:hypothetical protein
MCWLLKPKAMAKFFGFYYIIKEHNKLIGKQDLFKENSSSNFI